MNVWGPSRVTGQGGERYFLLVVDDYTRYTTVFPLQSKAEVRSVLIHSIRIRQSFTLLASPQQNGIAERRIGLVMEVARSSMVHAAAPHFLWSFAVQYAAAQQLNLWPRVSHPETSPTLRWTGEVGDASVFRVWAEGGDPPGADTVAPRRSARLAAPLSFPPRPSSPLRQPVAVDSGAAGGEARGAAVGGARGVGAGGTGVGGDGGPSARDANTSGARAGGARAGGARGTGAAGARGARTRGAGGARAAGAGGTRDAGTGSATGGASIGATGGTGAAGAGGARVGDTGGTGAAGAGGTGAAGAGGATAGGVGGSGAGGTGGAGGAGAADGTGTAPRRPFFYEQPESSLPPPGSALRLFLVFRLPLALLLPYCVHRLARLRHSYHQTPHCLLLLLTQSSQTP
ncbi:unnamed protein product [Closterium sp. Yama58-4]|nr:unnamed protein product [Closterium sp. Yama58-4]